jgi:DNA-binding NtrC family response regulator
MIETQCGILLIDDEPAWLRSMQMLLTRSTGARHIIACSDSREALGILEKEDIGLVLLDLTMPHISGEAMLTAIQEKYPDVLVIIITGMNTADKALQCLKAGAFDYFVKTWGEERLLTGIAHALRVASLEKTRRETSRSILSEELAHPDAFHNIITASAELFTIFRYMESVLPSRYPFLITGESGVGKELVARAAHTLTGARGRFVSINMASLEGAMLEDTLFGHVKGAYTNASGARAGLVEQAQGGTLFLDEIGELSLQSQARLLRFLQEGEYYPIGADSPKKVAARIVLATNRDIRARQNEGQFRKDLYFRLSTHHVHLPPLRERREDIPLLIRAFLEEAANDFGCPVPHLPKEVLLALMQYPYPGNVRELKAMHDPCC